MSSLKQGIVHVPQQQQGKESKHIERNSNLRKGIIATTISTFSILQRMTGVAHAAPPKDHPVITTEAAPTPSRSYKTIAPLMAAGTTIALGGRAYAIRTKRNDEKEGESKFHEIMNNGESSSSQTTTTTTAADEPTMTESKTNSFDELMVRSEEIRMRSTKLSQSIEEMETAEEEESESQEATVVSVKPIEEEATLLTPTVEDVSVPSTRLDSESLEEDDVASAAEIEGTCVDDGMVNALVEEEPMENVKEPAVGIQIEEDIQVIENEIETSGGDLGEEEKQMKSQTSETLDGAEFEEEQSSEEEQVESTEIMSKEPKRYEDLSEEELAKRYGDIDDLGERAFQILVDLGMVDITPDPDE